MKRAEKQRLILLKEYIDGWNWELEPWFTLPKEDGEALSKALEQYFKALECRQKLREKKHGGII